MIGWRKHCATTWLLAVFAHGALARGDDTAPIRVSVAPSLVRLGVDRFTRIEIDAPDVPIDELDVTASVGTVRDVARVRPGHFVARFEPPESHAPDIALIVARLRHATDVGFASIVLAGRYHLTLHVEPNVRVRAQVEGGPEQQATVPASGALDIFLHVPPGVDRVHIVATDPSGNRTERVEPLDVPPLHRAVLLSMPSPHDDSRAIRWGIVVVTRSGAPSSDPPTLDVSGALAELTSVAPGRYELVARPPRRMEPERVVVRLTMPAVVSAPPEVDSVVPAVTPVRIELAHAVSVRAGEPVAIRLSVRDESGSELSDLEHAIAARVGDQVSTIEHRGSDHVIAAMAPEHAGTVDVSARLDFGGSSHLEAHDSLVVVPGPPVRLEAHAESLTADREAQVTLRAMDRFGNPALVAHPAVDAVGASVLDVEERPSGLRLRLLPTARVVRLTVRGDYDFRDTVTWNAEFSPARPVSVGLATSVRWNLGAVVFVGGHVFVQVELPLVRRLLVYGSLATGVEGATASDSQGNAVTLEAVPLFLRSGIRFVFGNFDVGPTVAVGGWAVFVQERLHGGDSSQQTTIVPSVGGGVVARLVTHGGRFGLEAGGVSGTLDTPAADGAFGGLYSVLSWTGRL